MAESATSPGARTPAWESAAVPEDVYAEIQRALASAESPVGIDAKHTHVLILHALERIERRLSEPAPQRVGGGEPASGDGEKAELEVRRQVRGVLERSPAFASLRPTQRVRMVDDLTGMVMLAAGGMVEEANFPDFVAELIRGTFEAVVDASVKQMQAYADLLEEAAAALGDFVSEARSDAAATQRQRLLATMVLMGVKRIRLGGGHVRAKTILGGEDEDDD